MTGRDSLASAGAEIVAGISTTSETEQAVRNDWMLLHAARRWMFEWT